MRKLIQTRTATKRLSLWRVWKLFYLTLSHTSLSLYYKTIFAVAQHHKYQISEIENLIPYERDLYLDMLLSYINEKIHRSKGCNMAEETINERLIKEGQLTRNTGTNSIKSVNINLDKFSKVFLRWSVNWSCSRVSSNRYTIKI